MKRNKYNRIPNIKKPKTNLPFNKELEINKINIPPVKKKDIKLKPKTQIEEPSKLSYTTITESVENLLAYLTPQETSHYSSVKSPQDIIDEQDDREKKKQKRRMKKELRKYHEDEEQKETIQKAKQQRKIKEKEQQRFVRYDPAEISYTDDHSLNVEMIKQRKQEIRKNISYLKKELKKGNYLPTKINSVIQQYENELDELNKKHRSEYGKVYRQKIKEYEAIHGKKEKTKTRVQGIHVMIDIDDSIKNVSDDDYWDDVHRTDIEDEYEDSDDFNDELYTYVDESDETPTPQEKPKDYEYEYSFADRDEKTMNNIDSIHDSFTSAFDEADNENVANVLREIFDENLKAIGNQFAKRIQSMDEYEIDEMLYELELTLNYESFGEDLQHRSREIAKAISQIGGVWKQEYEDRLIEASIKDTEVTRVKHPKFVRERYKYRNYL